MSALEEVFVRVYFRYELDPYAEDLERFASWLLAVGYPNKTARTHLFRVQQVLHAIGGQPGAVPDAAALERAFERLARRRWKYCHTHAAYTRYLRTTGGLAEVPAGPANPARAIVNEFCERLARRRGLAASTIDGYRSWISDFLRCALAAGGPLTNLTANSVESYIQSRGPQLATRTFRTAIRCVQAFLRYCHERGRLPERIDQVDLPRGFRPDLSPRALPWSLVGGPIFVYSKTYEKGRLEGLARRHVQHAEALEKYIERLVDLQPLVEDHFYHPQMQRSFSIKKVLPVIAPDLKYSELEEVQEGTGAQAAYLYACCEPTTTPGRKEELRQRLHEYCEQDTWAMVEVGHFLEGKERPTANRPSSGLVI